MQVNFGAPKTRSRYNQDLAHGIVGLLSPCNCIFCIIIMQTTAFNEYIYRLKYTKTSMFSTKNASNYVLNRICNKCPPISSAKIKVMSPPNSFPMTGGI